MRGLRGTLELTDDQTAEVVRFLGREMDRAGFSRDQLAGAVSVKSKSLRKYVERALPNEVPISLRLIAGILFALGLDRTALQGISPDLLIPPAAWRHWQSEFAAKRATNKFVPIPAEAVTIPVTDGPDWPTIKTLALDLLRAARDQNEDTLVSVTIDLEGMLG